MLHRQGKFLRFVARRPLVARVTVGIDTAAPDLSAAIAAAAVRLSRPISASPVGVAVMIGPEAPRHKSSR